MVKIFGFEFKRVEDPDADDIASFAPEVKDDGAVVVSSGGSYGTYVDLDGTIRTESELVSKYREISMSADVEIAIDDIVNECIVDDNYGDCVDIDLDKLKQSDKINKLIKDEFDGVLQLLDFTNLSYDVFKRWYVDGRLYYHAIIDNANPTRGVLELRYIDPRKIRKVREQEGKRAKGVAEVIVKKTVSEYYLFNDKGFGKQSNSVGAATTSGSTSGVKIAKDSIVYVTSGLLSQNNDLVLSYLHKAIKPLNQLRSLEDATIIYKLSRAPDRRVFYIDIGNLPKMKAEQYIRDLMTKFKNKVVYDASTGEIRDDRKFMTMLEDFWLPRREGGRGTEVTTLQGSGSFSDMSDVEYFQKNLYKALNVPVSRMQDDSGFNLGRSTEISRDEIKFAKFVTRLRKKFSQLFSSVLGKQLILKGVVTVEEWDNWRNLIRFKFNADNLFEELKETEILRDRVSMLKDMEGIIGKYYSEEWVNRNILRLTKEESDEIRKQIIEERNDPFYAEIQAQTDAENGLDANPNVTQSKPPVPKKAPQTIKNQ